MLVFYLMFYAYTNCVRPRTYRIFCWPDERMSTNFFQKYSLLIRVWEMTVKSILLIGYLETLIFVKSEVKSYGFFVGALQLLEQLLKNILFLNTLNCIGICMKDMRIKKYSNWQALFFQPFIIIITQVEQHINFIHL